MDKKLVMKLAKILAKFEEIKTDKANLTIDGNLEVGAEVYIYTEEGEPMPAEDGEYVAEDEKVIIIKDGKVAEIKEKEEEVPAEEETIEDVVEELEEEQEETPAEEVVDEKDARIAELEAIIADKDAKIAELQAALDELNKPIEEPVEMSKVVRGEKTYDNPALKYFEK